MKTAIRIFLITFMATIVAGQKYNPYTHRYETVPSDWETKYNPYDHSYSYQPKNARVQYNPYEHSYDWDSGHN